METVRRAIRRMCVWCRGGRVQSLSCAGCPLEGIGPEETSRQLLSRVRAFCVACAGSAAQVELCAAGAAMGVHAPCALHPFRRGVVVRQRQLRFGTLGDEAGNVGPEQVQSLGYGRPGSLGDETDRRQAGEEEHGPQPAADDGEDADE